DSPLSTSQLIRKPRYIWPWPDKAHLAQQNVPQLRQLVYLRLAKPPSQHGNTWIAGTRNGCGQTRIRPHGLNLNHVEKLAVFSDPELHKKAVTARVNTGGNKCRQDQPPGQQQTDHRQQEIKRTL